MLKERPDSPMTETRLVKCGGSGSSVVSVWEGVKVVVRRLAENPTNRRQVSRGTQTENGSQARGSQTEPVWTERERAMPCPGTSLWSYEDYAEATQFVQYVDDAAAVFAAEPRGSGSSSARAWLGPSRPQRLVPDPPEATASLPLCVTSAGGRSLHQYVII